MVMELQKNCLKRAYAFLRAATLSSSDLESVAVIIQSLFKKMI